MKKIILLIMLCILSLCGCGTDNNSTVSDVVPNDLYPVETMTTADDVNVQQDGIDYKSYMGLWQHTEYPDAYSIIINSLEDGVMSLTIEAVKGNYSRIATAEIDDAYFNNNKTRFEFVDSFNNSGICEIEIIGDEMTVSYETNTPYQGGWCIDSGEGTYKKAEETPGISNNEINDTLYSEYRDDSTTEESVIPSNRFFDSGKYVKVMGYRLYNEDVYDKDIYYEFNWRSTNINFVHGNYSDRSFGRDEFGEYKVLTSNKPTYNFKLVFDYADGHQEIFYVKTVIDRTVFDFYLENDTPYGRFENYDNYAVQRTNPDGKTYRFRYDYEYKEDQKGIYSTPMDSPFKDIR